MKQEPPLFERGNTLTKLGIILVATIGAPILFLVHTVTTFYSATFKEAECYSVKVSRPDGLSNAQWAGFCELMDGEDFEGTDFWGTIDSLFQEVLEDK